MTTRLKKEHSETVTHLKKENSELKASAVQENKFWVGPDGKSRMTSPYSTSFFHTKEVINDILTDEKKLHANILSSMSVFECILEWFVAIADTMDDGPLFWENADRASDSGNRCKLRYDEALLLILMWLKSARTQDDLAVAFGIDQSTVSRYIDFSKKVLEEILPTAKNMNKLVKSARTRKELERLVPGMITIIDGTHIRTERPTDSEERNARFGPKKMPTANTAIMINKKKIIIGISDAMPGRVHDLNVARSHMPALKDLTTRAGIAVFADRGYKGLDKFLPESYVVTPHKTGKNTELSKSQIKDNANTSLIRVIVEHVFAELKQFKTITGPYAGTLEELNQDINLVTGLVNLKRMGPQKWDPMCGRLLRRGNT